MSDFNKFWHQNLSHNLTSHDSLQLSCPPHLTNVSTLLCKTHSTSFVALHYILFHRATGCGLLASNFHSLLKQQFSTVNNCFRCVYCYTLYIVCRLIIWLLIKFAVTVFSVLWHFQSHAAIVKRYNAFCVKLTANSDTKQNNISKSTFPVHVSKHFHI